MGPNFWRHPANGLKKCSEKTRTSCTDHDDCCAVTACTYCLELEVYGDPVQHGVADQAANHWTGTVGGYPFDMYWERNYETGVCELIVIFDGEEVYRKSCEDGQSCRDSSDEVEVIVGYPPESATLRWIKHEPLQLPHIDDPDTGCKTWFCGECECSCDCLCVTISDMYGTELGRGEICTTGYDCEGPVWQGTIGDYILSLALERGEYGECVIAASVDGYLQPPVVVTGCKDLAATIILDDGTIVAVECKICDCQKPTWCPCCPGWPQLASGLIHWTTAVETSNDCQSAPTIIELSGDFGCVGTEDEIGTILREEATNLYARVFCVAETEQWKVQYRSLATSYEWVDVISTFICPDCGDAVDGVATGTIDFIAVMACETSGGIVNYNIICHADVELACP